MPLTADFSVSQPLGEPSIVTVTDTSTGSDGTITARRVYIKDAFGNFIVPEGVSTEYNAWSIGDTSVDIDCLTKDIAALITVEWLNGTTVVYSKIEKYGLVAYNEDFDYSLTQMLAANPMRTNDSKFLEYKFNLRAEIDSGNQALERYGDMFSAQQCYDRATTIRINSQFYFNLATA